MLLSDLPVELLQTILQHLIPEWPGVQDDHDEIREALGLRLVCSKANSCRSVASLANMLIL
jgi:hypothetical protein